MPDQYWLTKAQLKRIEFFFPRTRGIPRVDDRRVAACGQGDNPCDSEWSAMAGCARGLCPPHDALQPVRSLVPHGYLRPNLRQPCGRERPTRPQVLKSILDTHTGVRIGW